ncbi:hypothetical protein HW555_003418 [Spodoptera exigua]|uniref:Uncharacterized protein n=1 Tax=Spodoptera exigua TaxID=7107 RepID=A0A835GP16_SPOEX|nr:hypothetical protein HW555_003418 [Spodoptera exigua]KAH9635136.1 hypothetical protein HF086_000857 [Spodoptera exigua]
MMKQVVVILTLLVCCYCLESNEQLPEEARAKKKKGILRLLAIAALVVLSKLAVIKVASFFFLVAFFQKLFYLGGVFLTSYMKNQSGPGSTMMYGPPLSQEYNTVGYSYEPADQEPFQPQEGLPGIADVSNGFNWLFSKNQP